jgi:NADH:ubiquinone oxidoreductase subunit B-like Fe-S oxidoreductase
VESECAASAIFQRRVIAHGTGAITGGTYWSSLNNGTPVALPVDCKPCIDCTDPAPEE